MAKRDKRGRSQTEQRRINRKIAKHKERGASQRTAAPRQDHPTYSVSSGRQPDPTRVRNIKKIKAKRWNAIMDRVPEDERSFGAEVGVWYGDTSERILAGRPRMFLYLIDRWRPPETDDSYYSSGAKIAGYTEAKHRDAYEKAMEKVAPYEDRISVLIGNTVDMADKIEDKFLDFVFIDADHSYEGVCKDIVAYLPKIKKTGWIGGHDWNSKWEVERAVLEFFPREIVERDVNSTWFVYLEDVPNIDKLLEGIKQWSF